MCRSHETLLLRIAFLMEGRGEKNARRDSTNSTWILQQVEKVETGLKYMGVHVLDVECLVINGKPAVLQRAGRGKRHREIFLQHVSYRRQSRLSAIPELRLKDSQPTRSAAMHWKWTIGGLTCRPLPK